MITCQYVVPLSLKLCMPSLQWPLLLIERKYSLKMCLPSERQMSKITLAFILKSQVGDREF